MITQHRLRIVARTIAAASLLVAASGCGSSTASPSEPTVEGGTPPSYEATGVVHRFVIPIGTGAALERGETVDIMPGRLDIKVGDAVEIVNQDDRGHNVGLFYVGKGETVSQVFPSVAEFSDVCAVSESGQFTISVT